MNNYRNTSRQRGAALVIGLILLTVITLLAVVGMNISNSELASATSEQLRLRAFQAAETGVEYAMNRDEPNQNDVFHVGTGCHAAKITPVTAISGSQVNPDSGLPTDHYTSRISYMTRVRPKAIAVTNSKPFITSLNRTGLRVAMRSPDTCRALTP